jgi:hypothetical protein
MKHFCAPNSKMKEIRVISKNSQNLLKLKMRDNSDFCSILFIFFSFLGFQEKGERREFMNMFEKREVQ